MTTEEEDKLVKELRKYVHFTINRYPKFIVNQHAQDMESAGMAALLRSIRRFDPSRGMTLRNFCIANVKGALSSYLRGHRLHVRRLQAYQVGSPHKKMSLRVHGNPDEDNFLDRIGDGPVSPWMYRISYEEQSDSEIEFQLLSKRLEKYPKQRDAHVFRAYFGLDGFVPLDQAEIGKRLGISHQAVSLIILRVTKKLQLAQVQV